ncbi:hypothetical protein HJC04_04565 [Rhizobium sp. NLR8a]|uniref:hypothetical protein n=1 Tax=unclassified Rhizobium TaxID=2613769 RepID=UPI001C835CC0|nr:MULTISPECIES: hypothetical protein [unclassified Rhizobium]MBX5219597.1 hypothetical protein [Rhizobium sp. NLR8a]MBX5298400.1 hypothetical protein [Rhizobium sp. NLR12b]
MRFDCWLQFGFTKESLDLLKQLLRKDTHFKHEDVVSALAELKAPEAIEALSQACLWVPAYLEFDEARALAVKVIWALGARDPWPAGAGCLDCAR